MLWRTSSFSTKSCWRSNRRFWSNRSRKRLILFLWRSHWANFIRKISFRCNILQSKFVLKSWNHIFSLDSFNFLSGVLFYEILNKHISSSHSYNQLISFSNFNVNSFLSELIDSFWLSKEYNFHFLSFWIGVYKISKNNIDLIFSVSYVNRLHFSQLFILLEKLLNFWLSLVKLRF